MRLSDAMILGSLTCKMEPMNLRSCALGAAANACGLVEFKPHSFARLDAIFEAWPWLATNTHRFCHEITTRFDKSVCAGAMTIEQLIEYVRSIEPSCGMCNEFRCTCVTSETAEEAVQVAHV